VRGKKEFRRGQKERTLPGEPKPARFMVRKKKNAVRGAENSKKKR